MIPISVFAFLSLYELVTVPLYVRIIWVLYTNKEFQTPFFRMLSIIGACEIIHYALDVIFYRLPMLGPTVDWFDKSPSRWLTLVGPWAVYFFNYPVFFLQVAISVNRLTSVYFPTKNRMWWQKLWLQLVVLAFMCSFCMTAHRLPFNATTKFTLLVDTDPTTGYIPVIIKYDYYFIDQSLLTNVYNIVVLLLCCIINTLTFAKIMAMKRAGTLKNSANASTAELNLFVICAWMMLTLLASIAFQTCVFIARYGLFGEATKYALYTAFLFHPLVDDIHSMSQPWLLVFMCAGLRRASMSSFLSKLVNQYRHVRERNVGAMVSSNVPISMANVQTAFNARQQEMAPVN